VHLFLHDLYYGNSARTTSRLTFDNNAAASEKAACRGGGAAAAGVATRPGESLSQVRHTGEPGTLPASSAYAASQDVWPPPARVPTIGETRRKRKREREREIEREREREREGERETSCQPCNPLKLALKRIIDD